MKIQDIKKVCVIGAGDMGHGIAQLALMSGCEITLCDVQQAFVDTGMSRICASLEKLIAKGKCAAEILEGAKNGKMTGYTDIAHAVNNADLIVEVVSEKIPVKESVLRAVSAAARPDAIIASNTSTMSITMLAQFVDHPERFVGTHYFNPAVLMKLVEVIRGEKTSDETAQCMLDYVDKIGKISVYAKKDTPGFIANRVDLPFIMYNCLTMDIDGIAGEDIDATMMKAGWRMGPVELMDFTGVDILASCLAYYREHLSPEYTEPECVKNLVAQGKYGKKTGEGFYVWVDGKRPTVSPEASTGKYDPRLPYFIEANEACKLYEDGICSLEDCDKAMQYGFNTPGPVEQIQAYAPEEIARVLNETADHLGKEIFRPTQTIISGGYLRK